MRLKMKVSKAKSRTEKIKLTAELAELLDEYVSYYQSKLGTTITSAKVVMEMIEAFIKSDRDFKQREKSIREISAYKKNHSTSLPT